MRLEIQPLGYTEPARICILGGGFAGLYTALYLDRLSWSKVEKPEIILIDQKNRFLFTPFLYELITGELKVWEVAPTFQKLLRGTEIKFHQKTVKEVDFKTHKIQLENHDPLSYDYLVLAVGRRTHNDLNLGKSGQTLTFRTLVDAMCLQEKLQALEQSTQAKIRILIIGGGANAIELAGKLVDRLGNRGEISLIIRGQKILKTFSSCCQDIAYRSLIFRGVNIKFNTQVCAVREDSVTLIQEYEEYTVPVDLVMATTGTQAREWLSHLECQQNYQGKLLTQSTLQLLDYPEVFALGDLAEICDRKSQPIPATAQAAFQQANCAAKNLKAAIYRQRLKSFRYLHLGQMLTLGTREATVSSFGLEIQGILACLSRKCVYILLRMPTINHRYQVICHQVKRLILRKSQQLNHNLKIGLRKFSKVFSCFL
ncbi:MAG: FAD-dependent oxidoreductase [Cyanobacteriota bacterium]|nr:FAD-dependent oxidoreductase [Cyanobacteriota bacterium]